MLFIQKGKKCKVMEDKRVIKTKRNLKNTMIKMLSDKLPFEKITVSELCREGETSRITFYTYYDDKYDLIEDIFRDYIASAEKEYYSLQSTNNPDGTALLGYYNMLDCILNLYRNNIELFSTISPEKNAYLYSAFYQHIYSRVKGYIVKRSNQMRPKYPVGQMASFICNGFLGIITECYKQKLSEKEQRENIMNMFTDILKSDIFEFSASKI